MKTPVTHVALALALGAVLVLAQGPLTPPGAPAPTMKTLDQVEARAPIGATHTPGDASNEFIINQPGSYYLAGNLAVSKSNGIQVTAADVTIDLNGFQIRRAAAPNGTGIFVAPGADRCIIRDGSIVGGFLYGVFVDLGIPPIPKGGSLRRLAVTGCATYGVVAGESWQVEDCTAQDNLDDGILAGAGCVLSRCTASGNDGDGIFASSGCTLTACTAYANSNRGIVASTGCHLRGCNAYSNSNIGIATGSGCTLTDCTAYNNPAGISSSIGSTLTNCTAYNNQAGYGISAASGSTLTHCTARSNTSASSASSGISVGDNCTLIGCTATANTSSNGTLSNQTGSGIRAASNATIKDCTADGNTGNGILVDDGCAIADSTANNNFYRGIESRFGGTIRHCTTRQNKLDGIFANAGCLILENTSDANGLAGDGAGIHVLNNLNRLEANMVIGNDRGVDVDVAGNLIIRNTASNNTTNYAIVANNKVGDIVSAPNSAAISGSTGGAGVGSSDPWANLSF